MTAVRGRALVVGGSMGGLFAAALLRADGWDATIFERSTGDLAGRGAGIGLTRELLDAMAGAGVEFDPSIGIPVDSFIWPGRDGAIRRELPRPMVASAWARVFAPLRKAFPDAHYHTGKSVVGVEQDERGVTAIFADGSRETGDILIAADGSLSTVRQQFLPEIVPLYTGYVAWRGIVEERDLPADSLAVLDRRIVFSFAEREILLTMLVPGAGDDVRPGHRKCYFIWYRPVGSDAAMRDLFTDADGRHHGVSIPPPLIRREIVDALQAGARRVLAPQAAAVVERTPRPLLQAISDLECDRLVFGRVALLGDSAFVARPHVAGGISKAALDAVALADALRDEAQDLAGALRAYEASRLEFGRAIVRHARLLGSYIDGAAVDGAAPLTDPADVMAGYGAPHLLHDPDFEALLRK